jgi:CspA family cold shock protein
MAQYEGEIKWFNNAKGYGFVGHDNGPDVFIHYSSIQADGYKSLNAGDKVEFDIIQREKDPQADQVNRLSPSL